jgi:demethylmenaquinone methyltransferase/2-methoxy-6-polyprenyl-1,4-benzoquinol methylase
MSQNTQESPNDEHDQHNVDFGFSKVSAPRKRSLVDELFATVANKYDIMNDLMSLGVHRQWKQKFCQMIPNLNSDIIDVASGTGDIALRLKALARAGGKLPNITACDINPAMLELLQAKAVDSNMIDNLNIVTADAERLPFPDESFDYYTIAFGIRNAVNIDNVLKEAYRVLRPAGKFLCLEFSQVKNQYLASLYNFYSFNIIPKLGGLITQNQEAYQYLVESIALFPNQQDFKTKIYEAGFRQINYVNLNGGIAAIHYGFKI